MLEIITVSLLALLVLGGGCVGYPHYNVYQQRLEGEAELAKAEYSKRVAVQTAQAKLDASKLEAQTDVVRAEGIANANKIVADSLGGPEGYLRWKYIEMLEHSDSSGHDVIYVPTEAGLPILEAGKRK
jgi:regulator of protease activity HflC (stomatin/prohibitin superfamily)